MTRASLTRAGVAALVATMLFTSSPAARQPEAEKAILQAIGQINDAFQRRDAKAYEALITADFVRVGGNGRVFGRADWLRTVAAAGAVRRPGTFDQTSVRVYGDAALVTYRNKPVTADGKPGAVGYLTRVFEKQGAQWKMAFAQSTDLQPPPAPTGAAPAPLPASAASTPIEKEARAAFDAIQKANRDRDVAAWERLSAPDHVIIGADGARVARADRVAQLKAPPAANAAPAAAQTDVRLSVKGGSVAIVTWQAGQARSLKVLAKRGTGWQQVLQQSSPIVAPKP
jgi:ketosteroid isomerase-like protein